MTFQRTFPVRSKSPEPVRKTSALAPRAFAPPASRLLASRTSRLLQRAIEVQNVDYSLAGDQYIHGIINQENFYAALGNLLNAEPFAGAHRNQRTLVLNAVSAQNFRQPDIDALTTAIVTAIRAAYLQRGAPLGAANLVTALTTGVRNRLVANLEADHELAMDVTERGAFDQLAQAAGGGLSRAKGVASRIGYDRLPGGIQNEVAARLTEIRAERALWTADALQGRLDLTLSGGFTADVTGRQRGLHYQGNHTNSVGWLPDVGAPANPVQEAATRIYHDASGKLKGILNRTDTAVEVLENRGDNNQVRAHGRRTEYERLRRQHLTDLADDDVKGAAMAALCGGVSAYIEFSMAGGISRLMYEPVNNRVYITAHYKWREGYNPFFQVENFPAV
jgi:hypothetical protein